MNRYSIATLVLCLVLAATSVWARDWNCLVVTFIGIAVVLAPMRATGDLQTGYDRRLMVMGIVPLAALIVLFAVNAFVHITDYYPISIAIQAAAGMAFGLMLVVFLNATKAVTMARRWAVLFAVIFTCSLSSLYMISTIYWMASTGFPLHNEDFTNTLENNVVNMMLMLPMAVTTFATIVYAIVLNAYLKRESSPDLARFRGGA
jgi:hypothetical protein